MSFTAVGWVPGFRAAGQAFIPYRLPTDHQSRPYINEHLGFELICFQG